MTFQRIKRIYKEDYCMVRCIDCGGEMKYIGNKEWECTECGTIYEIEGIDYDDSGMNPTKPSSI